MQNYGDSISESLQVPTLPKNFDELEDDRQYEQTELLRQRQLHYFYIAETARQNRTHYEALTCEFGTLRRKLFHHASDPWEGDNVTLKAHLILMKNNWSEIASSARGQPPPCPIHFEQDELNECLRLNTEIAESDEQLAACKAVIGIGPDGWVTLDGYEEAKKCNAKLKADSLEGVASDLERTRILEHWPFDDQDEDEYL